MQRLQRDFSQLISSSDLDGPMGFHAEMKDDDFRDLHVVIRGGDDGPYRGGLFEFSFKIGLTYPFEPPLVRFMSPAGAPQCHPNLYNTGKVCLSILGTWTGPPWMPTMTLETVIIYLRALLSEERAWESEPGYEPGRNGQEKFSNSRSIAWTVAVQYNTCKFFMRRRITSCVAAEAFRQKAVDCGAHRAIVEKLHMMCNELPGDTIVCASVGIVRGFSVRKSEVQNMLESDIPNKRKLGAANTNT